MSMNEIYYSLLSVSQLQLSLSIEWGEFFERMLFWGVLAIFVYLLTFIVLRWFVRRTDNEVDDVILGSLRMPLFVFVVFFGLANSLQVFDTTVYLDALSRILQAMSYIAFTYGVWRLIKDVFVYHGHKYSASTETAFDDVLLPVIEQLGPIVAFLAGLVIVLSALGVPISLLATGIGGVSFVTAFALQDTLSNVFAGISLLWDTPYRFGDFIILEDETVCKVKEPGIRVTKLENLSNYSVIYMPNTILANQSLVNITKPTPDLISSITVGVGYAPPEGKTMKEYVSLVEKVLDNAVKGHPDVLGTQLNDQLEAITGMIIFDDEKGEVKRRNGIERFEAEVTVNEFLLEITKRVEGLQKTVEKKEQGGVSKDERDKIYEKFIKILAIFGWTVDEDKSNFRKVVLKDIKIEIEGQKIMKMQKHLVGAVGYWIHVWSRDPNLTNDELEIRREKEGVSEKSLWERGIHQHEMTEDEQELYYEWKTRIELLGKRLTNVTQTIRRPGRHERSLDDLLEGLLVWLDEDFKRATPGWKDPSVYLDSLGASSLDFKVEYYIDNIALERYGRETRVNDQIKREVLFQLSEEGIELPFPQQDVWLRDEWLATYFNNKK